MFEELIDLKTFIICLLILCIPAFGYFYGIYDHWTKRKELVSPLIPTPFQLPELKDIRLTVNELLDYDGTRSDGRILVALKGLIYDVSSDVLEFGVGGTLSHVAGNDFTQYLRRIMNVHHTEINYVERWGEILETNYKRVGFLIDESGNSLVQQHPEKSYDSGKPLEGNDLINQKTSKDNNLEKLLGSAIDKNEIPIQEN
ncbi:membrane steroid-binding protein 2 [Drosophila serrata]|uniref:membrane steroid-binding protein 2 n=1 Tax=Drosophila serrata TaxID=7274 RepID=UPI000A1D1BCF|nr:membrane steroid-binding protein 2 [Drosophila serrata]